MNKNSRYVLYNIYKIAGRDVHKEIDHFKDLKLTMSKENIHLMQILIRDGYVKQYTTQSVFITQKGVDVFEWGVPLMRKSWKFILVSLGVILTLLQINNILNK
jgi:hypothetical protein